MEAKKILGLIKDDIAHLEEITREFSVELLPSADDVDLAIIRAKALLTELEMLQKLPSPKNQEPFMVQHVDISNFKQLTPVDLSTMPIEMHEKTSSQNTINVPMPEIEVILQTAIGQKVEKENNFQKQILEPVAPANEFPGVKEQMIQNESPVSNVHKKDVTDHIMIEGQKSINETIRNTKQSENDFLPNENNSLGYPITPIKLIWDAVGINDRFLFVRELFDNDSSKFESTVRALDELTSIQEAVNYLKMNFKWNNSEASQRFLILVKQRFTK